MFQIENYINLLTEKLKRQFGSKLTYVGLQGSYLRGEATPQSDIDIMVVLNELGVEYLNLYRSIIYSMEHSDKSCGFICSKSDLENWNPLEICHLLHSTKDYYGTLSELVPVYTELDIRNFVKLSVNNLYHGICHMQIHSEEAENIAALPAMFKGVFFILQNIYFLSEGKFIGTKAELETLLEGSNYDVLKLSIEMNNGASYDYEESFELLFKWCQETLKNI